MSFELSKKYCPELPWCNDDPMILGNVVSDFTDKYDQYLAPWAQRWFENFQYIYGNHDVQWSKKWGFAVDVDFMRRGTTAINQRSQTNATRTIFESLSSLIFGSMPGWEVMAADSGSSQGTRFQKLLEKMLDCYFERMCMDLELRSFTNVLTAYGMAAAKISWNRKAGRIMDVPVLENREANLFESVPTAEDPFGLVNIIRASRNSQGEPRHENRLLQARGDDGSVRTKKTWTGDVEVQIRTPFEYRREMSSKGAHKSKWFQDIQIMDYDEYATRYEDFEGRTKFFDKVRPGTMSSAIYKFALRQFIRMQFVTPVSQQDVRRVTTSSIRGDFLKRKVCVIEHYDEPNEEMWPEGRLTVVVNGYCTHMTQPQFHTNTVGGWHPFVEANWLQLAPSPMPTAPISDITAKNKELNILDSLTDTATLRNMGSTLLLKTGSGLDPQQMSGDPGQVLACNDPMNSARWLRDDQPIPPVISEIRNAKKEDMYEISGAQDAIRGDRSKNVSSGFAFKVLEEREQRRLTPVRRELERATGRMGQKIIACVKSNAMSLDEDVLGYLKRSAAGGFNEKDILAFLRTPTDYGVDVNVTAGSMVAKSKSSAQATLMDIIQKTAAADRLQNAEVMDRFLRFNEVDVLRDDSAVHRDRARRENELFGDIGRQGPTATGIQIPTVCSEDDHEIHIASHSRDLVEKFEEICSDEFEMTLRQAHIEFHRIYIKEKAGEVPAGTAHAAASVVAQAQAQPERQLPELAQRKMAMDQQKAAQPPAQQQAQGGGAGPSQNPSVPAAQTPAGQQATAKVNEMRGSST
jgi:hypothetical protein